MHARIYACNASLRVDMHTMHCPEYLYDVFIYVAQYIHNLSKICKNTHTHTPTCTHSLLSRSHVQSCTHAIISPKVLSNMEKSPGKSTDDDATSHRPSTTANPTDMSTRELSTVLHTLRKVLLSPDHTSWIQGSACIAHCHI